MATGAKPIALFSLVILLLVAPAWLAVGRPLLLPMADDDPSPVSTNVSSEDSCCPVLTEPATSPSGGDESNCTTDGPVSSEATAEPPPSDSCCSSSSDHSANCDQCGCVQLLTASAGIPSTVMDASVAPNTSLLAIDRLNTPRNDHGRNLFRPPMIPQS